MQSAASVGFVNQNVKYMIALDIRGNISLLLRIVQELIKWLRMLQRNARVLALHYLRAEELQEPNKALLYCH